MPFDSNSARQAGQKSKRGQAKEVGKIRELILHEATSGRLRESLAELDSSQYVKAIGTLLQYAVPRLSNVSLTSVSDVQTALDSLNEDELRTIAKDVLKRLETNENE